MAQIIILLSFLALSYLPRRVSAQLLMMVVLFVPNVFLLALSAVAICGQVIDHAISYMLIASRKLVSGLKSIFQSKKAASSKSTVSEDTLPTSSGIHHAHSFGYSVRFLLRICHYILSAAVSPLYAGEDSYRIQRPAKGSPTTLVILFRGNGLSLDETYGENSKNGSIVLTMPQPCSKGESVSMQSKLLVKLLTENPSLTTVDMRAHSLGVAQALSLLEQPSVKNSLKQSRVSAIRMRLYGGFKSLPALFRPLNFSCLFSSVVPCLWGALPFMYFQWNYRNQQSMKNIINTYSGQAFSKISLSVDEYYCYKNLDQILGDNTHILSDDLMAEAKKVGHFSFSSTNSMENHNDWGDKRNLDVRPAKQYGFFHGI